MLVVALVVRVVVSVAMTRTMIIFFSTLDTMPAILGRCGQVD